MKETSGIFFFVLAILGISIITVIADDDVPGGEHTTILEHPYHAQVLLADQGYRCAGSIISEYLVLTSSRCDGAAFVRVGSDNKYNGERYHQVRNFTRHEKYDLMMIRVRDPFRFDEACQPIPLADRELPEDVVGWIVGYGAGSSLKKSMIPLVQQQLCHKILKTELEMDLGPGTICGGFHGLGGIGPCTGDLGGPLVVDGRLFGVISLALFCDYPYSIGFYVDVHHNVDWIRSFNFTVSAEVTYLKQLFPAGV